MKKHDETLFKVGEVTKIVGVTLGFEFFIS